MNHNQQLFIRLQHFTFFSEPSDVPEINDRVIVKSGTTGSKVGILRYKGEPQFASGIWCGVELIDSEGKNDGSISGHRCDSSGSSAKFFSNVLCLHQIFQVRAQPRSLRATQQSLLVADFT